MTVEEYLRAPFNELFIHPNALKAAAVSPAKLKSASFRAVSLNEEYEDMFDDEVAMNSVEYALSTLYYTMSATITGGTKSEKRRNRQISIGGYALTTRDRDAFRDKANEIRRLLGLKEQEQTTDSGGMRDLTYMRYTKCRTL